jgi:hypothetical protein
VAARNQAAFECSEYGADSGGRGVTSKYRGYGKGYSTFSYHVSDDHEAEALKAERAKKPNRLGMFILRLLGFKGKPPEPPSP